MPVKNVVPKGRKKAQVSARARAQRETNFAALHRREKHWEKFGFPPREKRRREIRVRREKIPLK